MCFDPKSTELGSKKSDWINIHGNPFSRGEHAISSCSKEN
jgi:hypothetical protein